MRYTIPLVLLGMAAMIVHGNSSIDVTGIYSEEEETTEQHTDTKVTDTNQEKKTDNKVAEETKEVDKQQEKKNKRKQQKKEREAIVESKKAIAESMRPHLLIEEWLALYGALQQMEHGDNILPRPPREDFEETAKWEAWKEKGGKDFSKARDVASVFINIYKDWVDFRKQQGPNWFDKQ